MIEFLTVFLGLVTGPQVIELKVEEPVVRVAIEVDGRSLADLASAPWAFRLNLGPTPLPHLLVATAFDEAEQEIDRKTLWLNQRPPAGNGARVERRAQVLIVRDPPSRGFLNAYRELFPDHRLHPPESLWLDILRSDLEVNLLHLDRQEFLDAGLETFESEVLPRISKRPPQEEVCQRLSDLWFSYRHFANFGADTVVQFLSPVAAGASQVSQGRSLFRQTRGELDLGLLRVARKARQQDFVRRLADAVAAAGMEAQASGQRRAVVLLLSGLSEDQSVLSPSAVKTYLDALQVPLFVWTLQPDSPTFEDWGPVRYIGAEPLPGQEALTIEAARDGFWRFDAALAELRRSLDSQRIAPLQGHFQPEMLKITRKAQSVEGRNRGVEQ